MLKRIRQYFFNRELSKCERKSNFRSWNDIHSILLLFESDFQEKNDSVRALIKWCVAEGKKVVACCFVDKKNAESASLDNYVVLDRSKVDWLQKPLNVKERVKSKFDVVIDLTDNDVIPLKYVLIWANSDFRCGKNRGEKNNLYYDFVIEMPKSPIDPKTNRVRLDYDFEKELSSQIVKYLKMINS
jgi:hypothetical protein